jgi:hypothetical protein
VVWSPEGTGVTREEQRLRRGTSRATPSPIPVRICPTCGEVYSSGTEHCEADGARLTAWQPISELELAPYTDVDALSPRDSAGPLDDTPRMPSDRLFRSSPSGRDRVLGQRYRLGRSLGVGGYGAVFAADDLQSGQRVAIKVLSPAVSQSSEMLTRFHREAIAASRIRHPNIVDVLDFDVDVDGTHFIAMEFLDGHDLADHLVTVGRLEPAIALGIAAQCAHGLAAAHRVGVLHRDLKPANVFLVDSGDGNERVKVIDFGISKLTRLAGDFTDVTSASKMVGTPRYMSPEHARGDELDGRADVYSLGVMLFEMLTGEPPFVGRSALELFARHLRAKRQPPSARVPALGTCPGLDALVVRALAAEREARFASMDDFADAIVACLRAISPAAADDVIDYSGEISGPRPAAPPRTRLAARFVPAVLLIAAAAVLAGVMATRADQAPQPREATTQPVSAPGPADTTAIAPAATADSTPDAGVVAPAPPAARDAAPAPAKVRRASRPPSRHRTIDAAKLGVSEW